MANSPSAHKATVDGETERDPLEDSVEAGETGGDVFTTAGTPHPFVDFIDFEIYGVNNTIVSRPRTVKYQRATENLFQREDISYQGFEWVLRFSWVNQLDSEHTYTRKVQEGLTIREGQETETSFGVSASFKGLGINAGGVRKNFSDRETSLLETIETNITVPAKAAVYSYQKQYNFTTTTWWGQHVPSWTSNNHFSIGTNGASGSRITRTAATSSLAEEYTSLLRRLSGSTTITAQSAPSRPDDPPVRRQFTNSTQEAQNWLGGRGVTGTG
ncbi:MAG: hypothetical protein LQ350_002699 [Teloschistes chrysophthalmus]|nr:MAG: hypothetical protein LQ350_002699 [Niorma chrysophthalma]